MKSLKFIAATLIAAAMSLSAQAGTPIAVVSATGTAVYGTGPVLSVEKDTNSGNRVKVKFANGFQYVADDAAWSKLAKITSGLAVPVAVGNADGTVYDISKSVVTCQAGSTWVSWTSVAQADILADGCAYFSAVKAAASSL